LKSQSQLPSAGAPLAKPPLSLVLILFVGSGCAALIYEIVWFQLLQLTIGSTAISLGVLLGTFMGGMCVGSLLLPRMVSASRHPLRVYAVLELAIAAISLVVLYGLPLLSEFYAQHVGADTSGIWQRCLIAASCLLPPTVLMGATLPAIARWVRNTPEGVSWLGFFYGGNIAGAVVGCLLAGFYLLRLYDMRTATFVAVVIDVVVANLALLLAAFAPNVGCVEPSACEEGPIPEALGAPSQTRRTLPVGPAVRATAHITIALSGMTALAAEVVWTRILSLMLGATVYTFSIILAVFLIGLGIGSSAGAGLARGTVNPRAALGWCQLLLAIAIGWTAYLLTRSLPFWPIDQSLTRSAWHGFQIDLLRCAWAILPAACLWGASFPLALAAAAAPGQDPGRLVGGVYAANTIGAILGALVTSIALVAWIGTQGVQQVMIATAVLAGLLMLGPALVGRALAAVSAAAIAAAAIWLAYQVPPVPWELVARGRYLPMYKPVLKDGKLADPEYDLLYVGEGQNASVAVTRLGKSDVRNFHVSGKIEASSEPQDMRLQRMLGHIPAMLHPHPQSVLIVGCGAGVTAGSFVVYPDVKRIVICEIEPLIPQVVATFFPKENYRVTKDPRVEIVYDDARHYLLRTKEKFDVITSDPIHPWVKGAATLYTKEYFELVRRHLNPGGMVTQWVPLYDSSFDVVKSELATFFQVFPHGTIWSNDINGEGYDTVALGQANGSDIGDNPFQVEVEKWQELWNRADRDAAVRSLNDVGLGTPLALLAKYSGSAEDLTEWLKDAQINRDSNLRLQYLAGLGLNQQQGAAILNEIIRYLPRYPEGKIIASDEFRKTLEALWSPNEAKSQ
jgi:spermidine synthase